MSCVGTSIWSSDNVRSNLSSSSSNGSTRPTCWVVRPGKRYHRLSVFSCRFAAFCPVIHIVQRIFPFCTWVSCRERIKRVCESRFISTVVSGTKKKDVCSANHVGCYFSRFSLLFLWPSNYFSCLTLAIYFEARFTSFKSSYPGREILPRDLTHKQASLNAVLTFSVRNWNEYWDGPEMRSSQDGST